MMWYKICKKFSMIKGGGEKEGGRMVDLLTQALIGQNPKLHAKLQRPSSLPTPLPRTQAGGVNGDTVGVAIGRPETVPH